LSSKVFAEEKTESKVKEPSMYKVLLLNDDYTTMEFVVDILVNIFHKSTAEATKIMLDVHKKGKGIVGIYTYDIANTKIMQVHSLAKQNNFPLKASMEEV
jgi:ATP-dependent Clp protease adaptor protein ClpS